MARRTLAKIDKSLFIIYIQENFSIKHFRNFFLKLFFSCSAFGLYAVMVGEWVNGWWQRGWTHPYSTVRYQQKVQSQSENKKLYNVTSKNCWKLYWETLWLLLKFCHFSFVPFQKLGNTDSFVFIFVLIEIQTAWNHLFFQEKYHCIGKLCHLS